ncbi:MAG: ribosomal protein uS13 [Candidatus Hodgkinia cicadicola]
MAVNVRLRVCGVDLNPQKHIWVALQAIYGVGPSVARTTLRRLQIPSDVLAGRLEARQLANIKQWAEHEVTLGSALRQMVFNNIDRLKRIGCYRGLRHRRHLPTRGQSTRTNAHTAKYSANWY